MKGHKTYADKGIQAGSRTDQDPPASSYSGTQCIYKALDNSQLSELCSTSHILDHSGAYIDPDTSLPDHPRYISEHPAVNNQRAVRYRHLGHGKPNHLASISDRIVSLPETSPPHRITQSPGRFVSMPQSLKMLRYSYDYPQPHLGRSESFDVSLTSNGTQTKSFEGEHASLGGTPQTPSPPSSPESVMIIGNEDQVPRAFLRPKSNVDDTDHGGWTPWKGSPPKPIPALHGPLSLPYARCPSLRGAEGTVIEGEDLTHMIWGLDLNSPQLVQSKHQLNGQLYKPLPQSIASSRSSEETLYALRQGRVLQNLCNRDVIDLSRPEFRVTSSRADNMQPGRPMNTYLSPLENCHLSRRDTQSRGTQSKKVNIYDFVRRDSPIQLYPTAFGLLSEAKSCNTGLGIDLWHGNLRDGTFDAMLVPHHTRESPLILNQPLESIYSTHIYQTPRNLPVRDTHVFEHIQSRPVIPTPPDTSSPRWSPRFRHSHITSMSPEPNSQLPSNHSVNSSRPPVPHFIHDTLVSSQQAQQTPFKKPELRSAALDSLEVVVDTRLLPPPYRSPDSVVANCFNSDGHNDDTQPLSEHRCSQDSPNIAPPSPASPELQRGLTKHQLRSIPLARLIQRRLSSVVEEEVIESGSRDIHRPPVSPPNANQRSECPNPDVSNSPKEDKKRAQIPSHQTVIAINSAAGPSNDHAKRAYKPPGHPSRRAQTGTRDAPTQPQKFSESDQPVASVNRFGGNKENTSAAQKTSIKLKKVVRKKRHFKQDPASSVTDN